MLSEGALLAGKYRLKRKLGEGGMGTVWAAHNEAIERDVAIKVMLPEIASDPEALKRFFNEAKIAGRIRNPGIVDVLDLGQGDDGAPFIVMEMLDGQPLDAWLESAPRPPLTAAIRIVRDVAQTIALAHERGIVHRDLKPANLFLHRSGAGSMVKILDFGISKVLNTETFNTTRAGAVLGSPAYMSPEQAGGKPNIDARSDIYSLGAILFEMLSGRVPHEAANYNALVVDIVTKDAPRLSSFVAVPKEVDDLVGACLQRDPAARIASAGDLAARLAALLDSGVLREPDARAVVSPAGISHVGKPVSTKLSADGGTDETIASGALEPGAKASEVETGIRLPVVATSAPNFGRTGAPMSQTLPTARSKKPTAIVLGLVGFSIGALAVFFWVRSLSTPNLSGQTAPEPTASTTAALPAPTVASSAEASAPIVAPTEAPSPATEAASAAPTADASASAAKHPPIKRPPLSTPANPIKPKDKKVYGFD